MQEALAYFLSFKVYVLLPILLFIMLMIVRVKVADAVMTCLTIGIGFAGIFVILDFFVSVIGPAIKIIAENSGASTTVLDVGWPPLSSISWSSTIAIPILLISLALNIVSVLLGWTKVLNVDIWNYWHFIFTGVLIQAFTGNMILAIAGASLFSVLIVMMADWTAQETEDFSGLPGIAITTLSGVGYSPWGTVGNWVFDRIPGLRNLKADPESLQKRIGIFGQPMILGAFIGMGIAIVAGYDIKGILELGISVAAMMYLLPVMAGILGKGLGGVTTGINAFLDKRLAKTGNKRLSGLRLGMDLALIIGKPSVMVTGLLLMPVALFLALVLPGVTFIPVGDLTNLIPGLVMVVVAVRGNILRGFILGIPLVIGKLYIASAAAPLFTRLAKNANVTFGAYDGQITSFLDGGNIIRWWFACLAAGELWAILCLPAVAGLIVAMVFILKKKQPAKA